MTLSVYKSDMAALPSLYPAVNATSAGDVKVSIGVAAIDDQLAADDLIVLCKLPAFHVPVDFVLESTDLDENTGIVLSVGLLNADENDLVATIRFIHEDNVARAGGVKRADQLNGLGLAEAATDRWIAVKVNTVASTKKAGTVRGKLYYATNPS